MALTDAQQKELYDAVMALTKRTPPGNALQRKAGDGSIPRVLDTGDGFYIVNILRGLDKRLADVEAKLDGPEQPPAA